MGKESINDISVLLNNIEYLVDKNSANFGFKLSGTQSGFLRYLVSEKHDNLMITINLEHVLEPVSYITIGIELAKQALVNKDLYKQIAFTEEEKQAGILQENFYTKPNRILSFFTYDKLYPDSDDLDNIVSYLNNYMERKHVYSIFRRLEQSLDGLSR